MILHIVFIILAIFVIFEKKIKNITKKYLDQLSLILLIVLAGMSIYSKDYENYRILYENNSKLDEIIFGNLRILNPDLRVEKGYIIFMTIIKTFTDNFNFFVLLLSFVTLGLRYRTYKKIDQKNLLLYILFYFAFRYLPNEMTQYRSSVASAMLFFTLPYIADRKLVKFLLCLFIGICFHKGTVVFFPLYFLYPSFLKMKYKIVYFLLIIILLLKTNIIINILDIFLKNDYHYQLIKINNVKNVLKIPLIPLIITIGGLINFKKIEDKYFKCAVLYMSISLIYFALLRQIPELAIRVSNYFYDVQGIIVVFILNRIKNKYHLLFFKISLIIILFIIFKKNYKIIFGDIGYRSIFNNY